MALELVLFILEFDFISRGVIMKRYLKVSCWSYYYVLIYNKYIRAEQRSGSWFGKGGLRTKDVFSSMLIDTQTVFLHTYRSV